MREKRLVISLLAKRCERGPMGASRVAETFWALRQVRAKGRSKGGWLTCLLLVKERNPVSLLFLDKHLSNKQPITNETR